MATSGTFTTDIRTGYQLKLVWNVDSQNIANNTTTVTAKVQLVSTGNSYTINSTATKNGTITINGNAYNFTFSAALNGNQTKTIYSKTVTIAHNSDGSKTCAFRADAGINVTLSGTYYGTVTVSGNGTFNTIPRASTPTLSPSTVTMGNSISISIARASSAFTHTLTYSFGSLSGTIASGVGTSSTWNVPPNLANAIPKATSGKGTITCKTYSGSTLIGSKSVSFTANVPNSVVPAISGVTITENTAGIAQQFQGFLQNKTKLNVSITAAGSYGSTITSYETKIDGATYHKNSFVSDVITKSGTVSVVTTVTDSRGRTANRTTTITVKPYSPPTIAAFSAYRCNSTGVQDYEGSRLNVEINFSISSVDGRNTGSYQVLYRQKGVTSWTTLISQTAYSLDTNIITSAVFNVDNSYDLSIKITDFFGVNQSTIDIPTAFTLVDFRSTGKGIEFGAVANEDGFGVSMDAKFRKNVNVEGNFTCSNIQTGRNSVTPSAANVPTAKSITFPKPFTSVPCVVATLETTVAGTTVTGIAVNDITVNGFKIYITRTNTTNTYFQWIAIGT